jgi:hypothetical protein
MYATAIPVSGLIKERNHTAGEKIHCEALGCVREVFDWNGHSTAVTSVTPDSQLDRPHLVAGMA